MVPVVGILALQGDFEAHARVLRELGAEPREVRIPADLEGLDGLILPGGESTVMTLGIAREGLAEPLRELVAAGTPVLGTCAGLIVLDRDHLGALDLELAGVDGGPVRAVFIRAPWIDDHGPDDEVLAEVEGHPIAARQGNVLVLAFHPELGGDRRVHELFLDAVRAAAASPG